MVTRPIQFKQLERSRHLVEEFGEVRGKHFVIPSKPIFLPHGKLHRADSTSRAK